MHVWLFAAPWTVARQAPLSMAFSGQECWSGVPFPTLGVSSPPRDRVLGSVCPALAGGFFTTSATRKPNWLNRQPLLAFLSQLTTPSSADKLLAPESLFHCVSWRNPAKEINLLRLRGKFLFWSYWIVLGSYIKNMEEVLRDRRGWGKDLDHHCRLTVKKTAHLSSSRAWSASKCFLLGMHFLLTVYKNTVTNIIC